MTKKPCFWHQEHVFFISSTKVSTILLVWLIGVFSSCSDDVPPSFPDQQFKNYSFDAPSLAPWENVFDSSFGAFWEYDGRYSQSVFVRGHGVETHSRWLMQGDFPAGTYTVRIAIDNKNEIADISENGVVKIAAIDQNGTWILGESVLMQGYQVKEFTFNLSEDFNMIGLSVGRIGRGNHLEMSVLEFKIVQYEK